MLIAPHRALLGLLLVARHVIGQNDTLPGNATEAAIINKGGETEIEVEDTVSHTVSDTPETSQNSTVELIVAADDTPASHSDPEPRNISVTMTTAAKDPGLEMRDFVGTREDTSEILGDISGTIKDTSVTIVDTSETIEDTSEAIGDISETETTPPASQSETESTQSTEITSESTMSILPNKTHPCVSCNYTASALLNEQLRNLTGAIASDNVSAKLTDEEQSYFVTFEEWKRQKANEPEQKYPRVVDESTQEALGGPLGDEMEFEPSMFTDKSEGKPYKGRFNYASFDCAATIVRTNTEAKGAKAVLNENKDSYLLNQCSAPHQFLEIELCEDILVDEVLVGNYEFFSSVFKDVRISVSDRYPSADWKLIGEFHAANLRKLQLFKIEDPMIWAKYIRIEFVSHYGSEFYCPVSAVQVHGKTMMEQFKEENMEFSAPSPVGHTNKSLIERINSTAPGIALDAFESNVTCLSAPHLGLEQFLEDHRNGSGVELCPQTANQTSQITTTSISSGSSQESIYRNITKRLSLLEANATLSLLYIEEQSKILSEAFQSLEGRENARFDKLLGQLNTTIQTQVVNFQSLNVEIASNFEQLFGDQHLKFQEMLVSTESRMTLFQSSLTFQKSINVVNLVVIIFLLVYILATREAPDRDYVFPGRAGHTSTPSDSRFSISDSLGRVSNLLMGKRDDVESDDTLEGDAERSKEDDTAVEIKAVKFEVGSESDREVGGVLGRDSKETLQETGESSKASEENNRTSEDRVASMGDNRSPDITKEDVSVPSINDSPGESAKPEKDKEPKKKRKMTLEGKLFRRHGKK